MDFWGPNVEKRFFREALQDYSAQKIFYNLRDGYLAYAPKGKTTEGQTIQSRNSLIGRYTENWCKDFFQPIASELGLYAVNSVVCPELNLTKRSDADVAFCTTNSKKQKAANIRLIFEVKISIVNNYKYIPESDEIELIGNHKEHKGNPSILRSDSMLKAIGKAINIRVSGIESTKIPILIIGSTPISRSYRQKVDFLRQAGVIQGFISLYPTNVKGDISETKNKGFQTFSDYEKLKSFITNLVTTDMNYFSSMLPKDKLGEIIRVSSDKKSDSDKADKFLTLLNDVSQ